MNNFKTIFGAFAICLMVFNAVAYAGTTGGIYDMSRMLQEGHPFATTPAAPRLPVNKPLAHPRISQPDNPGTTVAPSSGLKVEQNLKQMPLTASAEPNNTKLTVDGILSELRAGVLVHDEGLFSRNKEEGIDTNFEVLFNSPDFLDFAFSPRPHIGGTVNSAGNTSQAYFGLTWDWDFYSDFFLNFSLGGAYHTGEKETPDPKKKSLGCTFLFRESLDLGYQISGPHLIMFHLDHISNAKLCSTNEGLEAFGLRYGYRF